MSVPSRAVATKGNRSMTRYNIRGATIWVSYWVDGVRVRKSTRLKNTPKNIKTVLEVIIPSIDRQIASGDIYKKKPKTFEFYGSIFLEEKQSNQSYDLKSPYWMRVIDYFRGRDIDTITRLDIKRFLSSLNMKSKSKNSYKSCVKEIFELAVDDGVISFNPALNIRLKPDRKSDIEHYSKEEVRSLLDAADGIMKVYLLIAFNTGMRVGEILGLQLADFKDDGFIHIKRTRTKGKIGTGKTNNAIRKVPYQSFILDEVLKEHPKDSLFIFGNMDDAVNLRTPWKHVCSDADVPRHKLYSTRHTFATLMLQDNVVSINELAGLLGHSSPKITLEHYASVIESKDISFVQGFSLFREKEIKDEDNKVGHYNEV